MEQGLEKSETFQIVSNKTEGENSNRDVLDVCEGKFFVNTGHDGLESEGKDKAIHITRTFDPDQYAKTTLGSPYVATNAFRKLRMETSMRHLALTRTASAPVNIPGKENGHKPLNRVLSTGTNTHDGSRRITYDRDALLSFRYSPQSMTPPKDIASIKEAITPIKRRYRRSMKQKIDHTDANIKDSNSPTQITAGFEVNEELTATES